MHTLGAYAAVNADRDADAAGGLGRNAIRVDRRRTQARQQAATTDRLASLQSAGSAGPAGPSMAMSVDVLAAAARSAFRRHAGDDPPVAADRGGHAHFFGGTGTGGGDGGGGGSGSDVGALPLIHEKIKAAKKKSGVLVKSSRLRPSGGVSSGPHAWVASSASEEKEQYDLVFESSSSSISDVDDPDPDNGLDPPPRQGGGRASGNGGKSQPAQADAAAKALAAMEAAAAAAAAALAATAAAAAASAAALVERDERFVGGGGGAGGGGDGSEELEHVPRALSLTVAAAAYSQQCTPRVHPNEDRHVIHMSLHELAGTAEPVALLAVVRAASACVCVRVCMCVFVRGCVRACMCAASVRV
jgi:hypothetical protein